MISDPGPFAIGGDFYDAISQYERHTFANGDILIYDRLNDNYFDPVDVPTPGLGILANPSNTNIQVDWIGLTDTDPTTYVGEAGNVVTVNAGETGLEFSTPSILSAWRDQLGTRTDDVNEAQIHHGDTGQNTFTGLNETSPSRALDVVGKMQLNDGSDNIVINSDDAIVLSETTSNVRIGDGAGDGITMNDQNNIIGAGAGGGGAVIQRNHNIIGTVSAFAANWHGAGNISLGTSSGRRSEAGINNMFLGVGAGEDDTVGIYNILLGRDATVLLGALPSQSTAIGYQATIEKSNQSVIGNLSQVEFKTYGEINNPTYGAGAITGTPTYNLGIDANGRVIETATTANDSTHTIGLRNTVIGFESLDNLNLTSGEDNVSIGYQTGGNISVGDRNTFIGNSTNGSTSNVNNVITGFNAGSADNNNSVISGANGGSNATVIFETVAIGEGILELGQSRDNVYIGRSVASANAGFSQESVAIGSETLLNVTTGQNNVVLGFNAANGLTTGSGNVFIGNGAGSGSGNISNTLFIDNVGTSVPLIGGDFTANTVALNTTVTETTGDVYVNDSTKGIILTSPDATCWRIQVDNTGALTTTSITCP